MTGTPERRLRSLDGLRGLAALVVVLHHLSLMWPSLADPYRGQQAHGWAWLMTYAPTRILLSGREAVLVFFVLSGVVLSLPYFDGRGGPSWTAYYPRRLCRLYLPVWGSLVVATSLVALDSSSAAPSWVFADRHLPSVGRVLGDAGLLGGVSFLNGPLWSLRWEMWFSLLLPLYVLAGRAARHRPALAIIALGAVTMLGQYRHHDSLLYLPVFAAGVLLTTRWDDLGERLRRLTPSAWWLVLAASVVLLTADWPARLLDEHQALARALAAPLTCAGAVGLVVAFAFAPRCRSLAQGPFCQFVGKRSFSLYLVHWPVIAFVVAVLGSHRALVVVVATPLILLVTEGFYRAVERPSTRLSRRLGDAVDVTAGVAR